ncbi:MAG: ATP synthase subunit I [Deferrisomatales bacterium]
MKTPPDQRDAEVSPGAGEDEGPPIKEVSLGRIEILNVCLVAAAALASFWFSRAFALGVLAGGVLMAANFRVIVGVMRSVFVRGSANALNVGIYWLKFVGLMLLVGIVILVFRVDPIGFLVGLSLILVAITTEAALRLAGR